MSDGEGITVGVRAVQRALSWWGASLALEGHRYAAIVTELAPQIDRLPEGASIQVREEVARVGVGLRWTLPEATLVLAASEGGACGFECEQAPGGSVFGLYTPGEGWRVSWMPASSDMQSSADSLSARACVGLTVTLLREGAGFATWPIRGFALTEAVSVSVDDSVVVSVADASDYGGYTLFNPAMPRDEEIPGVALVGSAMIPALLSAIRQADAVDVFQETRLPEPGISDALCEKLLGPRPGRLGRAARRRLTRQQKRLQR